LKLIRQKWIKLEFPCLKPADGSIDSMCDAIVNKKCVADLMNNLNMGDSSVFIHEFLRPSELQPTVDLRRFILQIQADPSGVQNSCVKV
jgi:hypothetical protein